MSPAESRLVEQLKHAEEKRRMRELATFGVYSIKVHGHYTLPFFAPSDALAVQSVESMIHDEHLESLFPELWCIGSYCSMDGKIHSSAHRFMPYQLLASRISGTPERAKARSAQEKRAIADKTPRKIATKTKTTKTY